jgi:hypothetical protein
MLCFDEPSGFELPPKGFSVDDPAICHPQKMEKTESDYKTRFSKTTTPGALQTMGRR